MTKTLRIFVSGIFVALAFLTGATATAQNIFSGEPIQWAGRPNGYSTNPYNSDYRTLSYRKVSTTAANPNDGRGQWSTTINVQSTGGNIAPDNMPGGGGAGWLLISGPSSNRFQNKWNFNNTGQAAINSINGITRQGGGSDMGLNMSAAGYYTFNMRDAGYNNSEVFIGYTQAAPVSVTRSGQSVGASPTVSISTGATPSANENVYVRYRIDTNDFTTGTSIVQATGSGTSWTASLPCGTVYYYVFTSTRTLAQLNADSEANRSLAILRYDDNSGANYTYTAASVTPTFDAIAPICSGSSVTLPTTSLNGVTGTWSPAINNTATTTYTFTPGPNQCASATTLTVEVIGSVVLSNSSFNLTGTSISQTGCLKLTDASEYYATGMAWHQSSVNLNENFDFTFTTMQSGQADGMSFVLQQDGNTVFSEGGGSELAYYGHYLGPQLFIKSLAVEFDIYNSSDYYGDFDDSHIALVKNRVTAPLQGPFAISPALGGGSTHVVRFVWNAATKNFSMYRNGNLLFSHNEDIVNTIFTGNPMVYFGWVGASGGLASTQTVCPQQLVVTAAAPGIAISQAPAGAICAGTSVTFTATPSGADTPAYQWKKNGNNVSTESTYTDSALVNGDAITCEMTYTTTCSGTQTVISNTIVANVITTTAPVAQAQTYNIGATVADLVATGTALQWYAVNVSGTALSATDVLSTGTYYVSQTLNGCESLRTAVSVTICSMIYYQDADTDGFGNAAVSVISCDVTAPAGYVSNDDDCDDTQIFYADADGDGFGSTAKVACNGVTNNTDCNDADQTVWQTGSFYVDADGDGYDAGTADNVCYGDSAPEGYSATTNGSDCDDTDANAYQLGDLYVDADNDGYTSGATANNICYGTSAPSGYVLALTTIDCNDNLASVNPGAVDIAYDGIDNNCSGTIDETSRLYSAVLPSQCATTLTNIGSLIGAVTINGHNITGYRFEVTNTTTNAVQTINRSVPNFAFTQLSNYDYATSYSIRVMLQRNGIWLNYYGNPCLVSSPAITSPTGSGQVNPSQCGQQIATINTLIATTSLAGVAQYRFRITDLTDGDGPNQVQTIDRPLHWFSMKMLTRYNYGTTYSIEVAVRTNASATFGGYGAACTVTTPAVPQINQCNATIATKATYVSTTSLDAVTQYRFVVTDFTTFAVTTIDRPQNWFTFNMIPGYTPNGTFGVEVSVMTSGQWSPASEPCEITAPGAARENVKQAAVAFNAVAYPNPFADSFGIELSTSAESDVNVKVYDMTGRMLEQHEVSATDMESFRIGERYPTGIYNVILTQGDNAKTLRVIKR